MVTSHPGNFGERLNRSPLGTILCVLAVAALSVALIVAALWFWGAREVRGNPGSVGCLTCLGAVWLVVAHKLIPWLGLDFREDAINRKNPAALAALCCALLALAIAFAAGNLGEGPSYCENVFCAGLSTGGLFLLWFLYELCTHVSRSIADERNLATGLRFGGLLLAWGLILARAVTGNWHSADAANADFPRDGWPAGVICLAAIMVELFLKPSRLRPFPSWPACGLVPALAYLAIAAAWVWHLGRWEGMPA